ncbi:MAG: VPLPA-CTERM sorting domain-containing protein [Pseudomonadota bacterium]
MNLKLVSALVAFGLVSAAPAMAVTLDFEGIPTSSDVNQFYNGGQDIGTPTVTGPNYGISFGPLAIVGTNEDPSAPLFNPDDARLGSGILAPAGAGATMNSTIGFSALSFLYSALSEGSVTVWSGLDGTGDALYTFNLLANAASDGVSALTHWDQLAAVFGTVGHSVTFGDVAGTAGFDNIAVSQVPLPAAAWLLMSGLGGLGGFARRRRRAA